MKTLIYDLLLTEAWKDKVYPLVKPSIAKCSSIRAYMAVSIFISFHMFSDLSWSHSHKYSRSFPIPQNSHWNLRRGFSRTDWLLLPQICRPDRWVWEDAWRTTQHAQGSDQRRTYGHGPSQRPRPLIQRHQIRMHYDLSQSHQIHYRPHGVTPSLRHSPNDGDHWYPLGLSAVAWVQTLAQNQLERKLGKVWGQ